MMTTQSLRMIAFGLCAFAPLLASAQTPQQPPAAQAKHNIEVIGVGKTVTQAIIGSNNRATQGVALVNGATAGRDIRAIGLVDQMTQVVVGSHNCATQVIAGVGTSC